MQCPPTMRLQVERWQQRFVARFERNPDDVLAVGHAGLRRLDLAEHHTTRPCGSPAQYPTMGAAGEYHALPTAFSYSPGNRPVASYSYLSAS